MPSDFRARLWYVPGGDRGDAREPGRDIRLAVAVVAPGDDRAVRLQSEAVGAPAAIAVTPDRPAGTSAWPS